MNIEHFKLAIDNCNTTPQVREIAQRVISMLNLEKTNETIQVTKDDFVAILHITSQTPNTSPFSRWIPIFSDKLDRVDISMTIKK